jgi:phthiocerol/phenolphthiocerol synthesis type-I polyketide synthase E
MPDVTNRIAGLSEERRRLLERMLGGRCGAVAGPVAPLTTPGPQAGPLAFEHRTTAGEVKENYRRFYDGVNSQLDSSLFGPFSFFLNYGYAPDHSPQHAAVALPDHFLNKNSVRLVLELIGDCDLNDRRVLDVGCGRGGTVFVVKQFFKARSVQGVDLSPNAVAFCREHHRYDNVRFDEGDAEHLPFQDGQFDVVTNVESSHSYPNIDRFYAEVFRVLSPGGCFVYTDLLPVPSIPEYLAALKSVGFRLEIDRDITENVLISCDEIARDRIAAYDPGNDPELMKNFLAAPGSQVYDDMRARRWSYRIYRFRKPEAERPWPTLGPSRA